MPNPYLTEYNMICDLIDQVKSNCFVLEEAREIVETPEELQKFDAMLDGNKKVIEKAKQTLESLKMGLTGVPVDSV